MQRDYRYLPYVLILGVLLLILAQYARYFKKLETLPEQPTLQLKSKQMVHLGEFEIVEPRVVVGDPSYDLGTIKMPGLGAILENCQTGSWQGYVINKEFSPNGLKFTAELWTWHQSITNEAQLSWVKQSKEIGADTGQIGVFALQHYQDDKIVPANFKWTLGEKGTPASPAELWYSLCCEITLSTKNAGVIPFGVISSSGKGDGGYDYFIARDSEGKIIGIKILFVDDQGRG